MLRSSYYFRNLIKMVGVWDTVGSIGIPSATSPTSAAARSSFTTPASAAPSSIRTRHWRSTSIASRTGQCCGPSFFRKAPTPSRNPSDDGRFVEQRWFAGAHANIGGGYRSDPLPDRPLAWLQDKAAQCGLGFRRHASVSDEDLECLPTDSYSEFLGGLWKIVALGRRYTRWIMSDPVPQDLARDDDGRTRGRLGTNGERADRPVSVRAMSAASRLSAAESEGVGQAQGPRPRGHHRGPGSIPEFSRGQPGIRRRPADREAARYPRHPPALRAQSPNSSSPFTLIRQPQHRHSRVSEHLPLPGHQHPPHGSLEPSAARSHVMR